MHRTALGKRGPKRIRPSAQFQAFKLFFSSLFLPFSHPDRIETQPVGWAGCVGAVVPDIARCISCKLEKPNCQCLMRSN